MFVCMHTLLEIGSGWIELVTLSNKKIETCQKLVPLHYNVTGML